MGLADCPSGTDLANITTQTYINDNAFAPDRCYNSVYISGATGSLNFTGLALVSDLHVHDSPGLESLIFPNLLNLGSFIVNDSTSLLNISMPRLTTDGYTSPVIDITGVSSLQNFDYGSVTEFNSLKYLNSGQLAITNVTSITVLETDGNAVFPNLTSIEYFTFNFTQGGPFYGPFSEVTENIENIILEDGHHLGRIGNPIDPKTINGSLSIRLLEISEDSLSDDYPNSLDFSTTTIGYAAEIYSNNNLHVGLDNLETIGGNLSFTDNTNCSLNLNQLSNVVGDLVMIDNPNTTLPSLPSLERANNIYFRGRIDTVDGINLFPALTLVSGSVIIEAWNSDFNCSKLVAQYRDSIIHDLRCNGTDNTTETRPTQPSNVSQGLTNGAWAGVGVGIAVVVLGSIIALVWLFLRYRRQQNAARDKDPPGSPQNEAEVQPLDLSGLHEAQDGRIIREAPEGAVHEMPVPPAEKPDDHLRELAGHSGELPASSLTIDQDRRGGDDIVDAAEARKIVGGHDDGN